LEQQLSGLIVKDQSGFFDVETEDGSIYTSRLRGRLMEEAKESDIAAIGDRVKIQILEDGTGAIEEVLPRETVLSRAMRTTGRRGVGQAEREQVIIANANQMFIVVAAAQPTPNFKLLDRMLVAGEASEIDDIIIVVNKIDLGIPAKLDKRLKDYARIGYPILYTSAVLPQGIDELRALLKDRISVFTGPSGVGKTSLLNLIQPGLGRAVKAISAFSQEGVHTTRDSALIKLEMGGYLADTPGMRGMKVWDIEPDELDDYFVEIAEHVAQCRFGDCSHTNEPGCAVLQAIKSGDISRHRYKNFVTLREELKDTYWVY